MDQSRRRFVGKIAGGIAGTLATGGILSAAGRVRFGLIGAGDRGKELLREALSCHNTECVAVADIYARRLEESRALAPSAALMADYRRLLEDQTIDAVIIATPQHLHAAPFLDALDAGKHVYIEKTAAFRVDEAKRMRDAWLRHKARQTVQTGHQWTSYGQMQDAAQFLKPELMGKVTAIHGHMFRNTPAHRPQWARPLYPDMTSQSIDWRAFLGEAPERPFDAERYVNWRYFWDYSGGNIHENLSHQLAFWYKALDLTIPAAVTMTGGVFLWKDGREVPDTMSVSMEHSEELLFTWDSGFGNDELRTSEEVLGTHGSIFRGPQIRYTPQRVNRPGGNEMAGQTRNQPLAHMRDFLDAIRLSREPSAPFELGYRVSIACRMAVESHLAHRTVWWDAAKEEIV
jgi:predicted dehydrogenase